MASELRTIPTGPIGAHIRRIRSNAPAAALTLALLAGVAAAAAPARAADTDNEMAVQAKAVLEQHCSRCHEATRLKEGLDRPQGKFGFILDLGKLIKKRMVVPGNAAGSIIMRQIENGAMPKDMSSDCYLFPPPEGAYCGPESDEVLALRSWIDSLENPDLQVAVATSEEVADAGATAEADEESEDVTDAGETAEAADAEEREEEETAAGPDTSDEAEEPAPRAFVTFEQMIRTMALDLAEVPRSRQDHARYLTLTHLYNAGDDEEALEVYRMAVTKLLNSLSRRPNPVRPVVVDEAGTILRFDIQDLGWTNAQWDKIAKANPYFLQFDDALFDSMQDNTGTAMPWVRADWFAFVASQPPLYYDLLALPDNKDDFEAALGIDAIGDIDRLDVARAGFRHSGVSQNNRMIERHQIATGMYWESYDFAGNDGRRDFFRFPLGPSGVFGDMSEEHGFVHDGGEFIFELPNGFHAYYLATGKGKRIDTGPTTIVRDDSRRDAAVTDGISCMGCHDQGIKFNPHRPTEAMDEIREIVLGNISVPKEVRDRVEEIYPLHEEFYALMKDDAERYQRSLARAGVNMGVKYDGLEMVNALFARFEEDVTADLAAAEFGLTKEEFFRRLSMAGGHAYTLKMRFSQDRIPRDQFVKDYAELANQITDQQAISFEEVAEAAEDTVEQSKARPADAAKTFDMTFVPTTQTYFVGAPVSFEVTSTEPCFLTLINVDDEDQVQVIFPNRFNQDNQIDADHTYSVPGEEIGGFKFVPEKPGKEKVIAICNASHSAPRGIVHDFDAQAYTSLGTYRSFTQARLLSVEPTEKAAEHEAAEDEEDEEDEALVETKIDPKVDIVAQKAVVLDVHEKD